MDPILEKKEKREEFLRIEGRTEADVMFDDGGEYIITDDIEGQDDDGVVSITKGRKWYLPKEIQNND